MNKFIYIILFFVILGCSLEDQVDAATQQCEDHMTAILENVEKTCLTKEEILELIRINNKYRHRHPQQDTPEEELKNEK